MNRIFRYPGILLISVLSFVNLYGQQPDAAGKKNYSEFNLRTNLSSWLDYDAGFTLGVGYRRSDRFSMAFEPTWIFYNAIITDYNNRIVPSGIRIRTDVKYYISKRKKGRPEFFLAPELHYKNVKTKKEDLFGINCQNGQCGYFQNAVYTEVKKEWGGMLKLGLITQFPFVTNQRWFLEFYGGVGAKTLQFKEINLPLGGSFTNPPDRDFLNFRTDNTRNKVSRPLLPSGIRLYYILNH